MIKNLVTRTGPQLVEPFAIGVDTAAEILIVVEGNPERIRSEATLANLAGISPIPASSGMTSGRQRINHGGHGNCTRPSTAPSSSGCDSTNHRLRRQMTAEAVSKRDIIRCVKRYVIREVYQLAVPAKIMPQISS